MAPAANAPEHVASARRLLNRAAAAGAGLTLAVIVTSAYLRLAQAGLGCADWPACFGAAAADKAGLAAPVVASMRVAHRISAAAVGFIMIFIAAVSWGRLRRELRCAGSAVTIVALTLFLAVLGTATPGTRIAAVTLGNLLGGLALLVAMIWLWLTTRVPSGQARVKPGMPIVAGIALLALELVLGAWVSAVYADASCAAFPGCGRTWEMSGATSALFDPWSRLPARSGMALVEDPARAGLHMLHRFGAFIVTLYWCVVAVIAIRRKSRAAASAAWTAVTLVAQCALGALAVVLSLPLWLAVAHNACAAAAVLAATRAAFQASFSEEASVSAACHIAISK